ncbi:MAG TPA: MFS transporter [Trebonia sp.]|jgi:MFS family permease
MSWVLNAYTVVFAAFLIPAGRLADRFGRRFLFTAGLAIFGAGAAASTAAPDVALLIAGRAAQGAGAAIALLSALRMPARPGRSADGSAPPIARADSQLSARESRCLSGHAPICCIRDIPGGM